MRVGQARWLNIGVGVVGSPASLYFNSRIELQKHHIFEFASMYQVFHCILTLSCMVLHYLCSCERVMHFKGKQYGANLSATFTGLGSRMIKSCSNMLPHFQH